MSPYPLALVCLLGACSLAPERAELFEGISEPRTADEYELTVVYVPAMQTDNACRALHARYDLTPAPLLLFTYLACTWTQADHEVPPGQLPRCEVVLPEGVGPGDLMYDHEMAHCEGWRDSTPALTPERQSAILPGALTPIDTRNET